MTNPMECWRKCRAGEHPWQAGDTYTRCTDPRACQAHLHRQPDPADVGRRAADPVITSGDHSEIMRRALVRSWGVAALGAVITLALIAVLVMFARGA